MHPTTVSRPRAGGGFAARLLAAAFLAVGVAMGSVAVGAPAAPPARAAARIVQSAAAQVYAWGANYSDQLGSHAAYCDAACLAFVPPPGTAVSAVAAGDTFSLALLDDGTVWAWGGDPTYNGTPSLPYPVPPWTVPSWGAMGPNGPTVPYACPDNKLASDYECAVTPVEIASLDHVTALAAGLGFALARRADGTVWAWGEATSREAPGPGALSSYHPDLYFPVPKAEAVYAVQAIAAGAEDDAVAPVDDTAPFNYEHAMALRSDGSVWAWGDDTDGEAGYDWRPGTASASCAQCAFTPVQVASLTGVTAIAAGGLSDYALRGDGTVWAWGGNVYGQLGNGSNDAPGPPEADAVHANPAEVEPQGGGNLIGVSAIAAGRYFALAVGRVSAAAQVVVVPPQCQGSCKVLPQDCPACRVTFPDPAQLIEQSQDQASVVLSDPGVNPIQVTGVQLTGADAQDFAIASDSCRQATLGAGSSCSIGVRFAPGAFAFGQRTATLVIASAGTGVGARVTFRGGARAAGARRGGEGDEVAIALVGSNPISLAKLVRIPLVWAAGGALALLLAVTVLRRRRTAVAAGGLPER